VSAAAAPIAPGLFVEDGDGPRLLLGRCAACARHHFPAADGCPWCGAERIDVVPGGAAGTLWLWTIVAAPPPGYAGPLPYGFGVVTLDDLRLRVVARLAGVDGAALAVGRRMRLVAETLPLDASGATARCWAYAPEPA